MPSPKSPTLFTRLMWAPAGSPWRYVYRHAESGDWYAILRAVKKGFEPFAEEHHRAFPGWYLERDQNNVPVLRINLREAMGALERGRPQCSRCGCCGVADAECACDADGLHSGETRAICFPQPFTLAAALALEEGTDDPDADPDAEDEDDTGVA